MQIGTYDAELVEMLMRYRPEFFTPKEVKITHHVPGPFWMEEVDGGTRITSDAEDILNTAHAIEIKYGRDRAVNYIKRYYEMASKGLIQCHGSTKKEPRYYRGSFFYVRPAWAQPNG